MQKHYLRPEVTKPSERTWAGNTCIAKTIPTKDRNEKGSYWDPVKFFDGRLATWVEQTPSEEQEGPAAALRLYANWTFNDNEMEESKMFSATERNRRVLRSRLWLAELDEAGKKKKKKR
jgi:hypothetical protein